MSKTIAQQLNITDFPFKIKDKDGRIIYYESSDNFWQKWEYYSDGNERYYENSNGFWEKYEYDSNGNERYYENSNGHLRDNRPNKIITVNGIKYQRVD